MNVEHTKDMNGLDCNCDKLLVVFIGIEHGNRFFSSHTKGEDPTLAYNKDGVTKYQAFNVIKYVDTCKEAQAVLFGPLVAERLHLERLRERAKAFQDARNLNKPVDGSNSCKNSIDNLPPLW
jgi:hypothetical protein